MPSKYALSISFKSNEHPFSMVYDALPGAIEDDAEARRWECGMRDGLGDDYSVTLLKDGQAIPATGETDHE